MQIETRSLKFIEQTKHIQIYWRIGGIRYRMCFINRRSLNLSRMSIGFVATVVMALISTDSFVCLRFQWH